MKKQIWKTNNEKELNPLILEYISGEDLELDKTLIQYDIQVNKAHAKMLENCKLISKEELGKILKVLDKLEAVDKLGNLKLEPDLEDVHMNIEKLVTTHAGKAGEKLHTARSRNDQVMTDLYLFMKDQIAKISASVKGLQKVLSEKAEQYKDVTLPAYTHMQPAMPISFETWLKAYKCLLDNDLQFVSQVKKQVDACPLGACAVAGTSLPIDKEFTAKELGFSKSFENPLAIISSRGEAETSLLYALSIIMLHLNKLSNDLQLYSTFEFNLIELDYKVCTSSSIMPQKKNPDALEILHAKTAETHSLLVQNLMILKSLPSGFQRDTQQTKSTVMKAITITLDSLKVMQNVVNSIKPNKKRMKELVEKSGCLATEEVNKLVLGGVPFREAYKKVREELLKEQ